MSKTGLVFTELLLLEKVLISEDKWYCFDNNILHTTAVPGRHTQMANVESLNKTLGILLNAYMNQKEMQLKYTYRGWTDILDEPLYRRRL